jgi:hypothetical protein
MSVKIPKLTQYDLINLQGKNVRVYFNLHKKLWSIKDKKTGLVIGHCDFIDLSDCTFVVSEKGRQRVLKDKAKNVHAYVDGYIGSVHFHKSEVYHSNFTYNPYKYDSFVKFINNEPVKINNADIVYLSIENEKPNQRMINFVKI